VVSCRWLRRNANDSVGFGSVWLLKRYFILTIFINMINDNYHFFFFYKHDLWLAVGDWEGMPMIVGFGSVWLLKRYFILTIFINMINDVNEIFILYWCYRKEIIIYLFLLTKGQDVWIIYIPCESFKYHIQNLHSLLHICF
jgi:hypothetical protein